MPVQGIDNELRRLQAGLRALGERLEQEREAGLMTDTQMADLASTMKLMQRDLSAIKTEDLPRLQKSVDKINGTVQRHADLLAAHDKSIGLLQQFCSDQVKPMLTMAQENKLKIAQWGAIGAGGGAGLFAIIELIIKAVGS